MIDALVLQLAARGWLPGTTRVAALLWAFWGLAFAAVVAVLSGCVRQWWEADHARGAIAPAVMARPPQPHSAERVLDRTHLADPKAAALQSLHRALESAPGVTLLSAEFRVQPQVAPDRLDRLDVAVNLRGPYAGVKQVLGQWSARFDTSSLVAFQVQRSAIVPAAVEATATLALWTQPAATVAIGSAAPASSMRWNGQ